MQEVFLKLRIERDPEVDPQPTMIGFAKSNDFVSEKKGPEESPFSVREATSL